MNIAFVDSWLQSSVQGSGTAVGINGLQAAFQQLGHHVVRLSPETERFGSLQLRRLWFNARLPRLLQQGDFDVVVGFDIDGFLYSSRRRRLPFVASVKGVLAEEALQETGSARRLLQSLSFLERRNARHADLIVTTSRYCRRAIQQHYGLSEERIHVVPEGIDLSRWQRICRETPQQSDRATILCVARQYRRKRIVDLLRALTLVRQSIPQVRAVVVGNGPEHGRLRRTVSELQLHDIVTLTGEIPSDEEVATWYRRADVFCLPSIQEGFGIAFLEAMACGLPVVSTTATAIPEVVPHERAGILVTPRNPPALASALVELLRDAKMRSNYGNIGRQHVRRYDWLRVAGLFSEILERVVKKCN